MLHRIGAKSRIGFTWVESDLSWLIKCAQQSAKVAAASAVLKMQGHGHVAKKLQLGTEPQRLLSYRLCMHHGGVHRPLSDQLGWTDG